MHFSSQWLDVCLAESRCKICGRGEVKICSTASNKRDKPEKLICFFWVGWLNASGIILCLNCFIWLVFGVCRVIFAFRVVKLLRL